jgi:hypothetical protein
VAGKKIGDHFPIAVAHHVIEETQGVTREGLGMRASQYRLDAMAAEDFRQRIGQRTGLRIAGKEYDIGVGRYKTPRITQPVVNGVVDAVAHHSAPGRDRLRHHRGVLLGQEQVVENMRRAPLGQRQNVKYGYSQPARHAVFWAILIGVSPRPPWLTSL